MLISDDALLRILRTLNICYKHEDKNHNAESCKFYCILQNLQMC